MKKTTTKKKASAKKIFCTVCPKWEIKHPERCSNTLVHKTKKHYFCTKKCKERFEKAPEKFT
ncbi:MAG: YHS domain-containing protein [Bdellovibrionaceae bacterium]|nr:YHS domain-containing protein [Pseudobdellovibrionaceae bacterium]